MRYRAFISYSHADEAWARWLIRRLETYRVPPRLVGRQTAYGAVASRLGKFFRDRDELTAANDLSTMIRATLAESEALIVICSPAAANSRWVGAEIEAFRASGRSDRVLAFVVAGEPGQDAGELGCFPAALTAPGADGQPVEPLAADARPEADGRKRAFLKLVAGLIGVSFDQLAQREAQRKQRKLIQVAVASLAGMTLAIGLAVTAYVARNDAQRRQAQAEDIVGFMLGDLREKLTTVGRLDLMRAVDDKATGYFASLDPRDLSDATLEEQARSLTGIGQVRLDEGNHGEAMAAFREALVRSASLLERAPGNGQRLYDAAQAEFWIGFVALQQGDYDTAQSWLERYRDSGARLAAMDPGNFDWQKELAYGYHNLAVMKERRGEYAEAERIMADELALFRGWIASRPDDVQLRIDGADTASWLGSLASRQGRLVVAEAYFAEQVASLDMALRRQPRNARWRQEKVTALQLLGEAQANRGRIDAARRTIDDALRLAEALFAQDPENNFRRLSLGRCRWWQARMAATAEPGAARNAAAAATALLEQARDVEPKSEPIAIWLLRARNQQVALAMAEGDVASASAIAAVARREAAAAWANDPNERLRPWVGENHVLLGDVAHRRDDVAAARRSWASARLLLRGDAAGGEIPFARLDPLLRASAALGRSEEAAAIRARLDAAGYVPPQPFPDSATAALAAP